MFTIAYGSAKALRTQHLKRRLAWSTISNLSYVLLGVTTLTTAGLTAGMVHMVFHAVLKITLFFCVGAVHYKLHRDFVPDVEGCGVLMPVVFGSFTAAALGLMGVPPLTGFTSKWMLATAAAGLGTWMGYLGASVLILSAVLTALYLMQIVLLAFFPRQNRQLSVRCPSGPGRDPGLRMTVPITALAAARWPWAWGPAVWPGQLPPCWDKKGGSCESEGKECPSFCCSRSFFRFWPAVCLLDRVLV